ncbi:hypothetical protein [Desulfofundulus sp.]|uniref:hypothetical protein n=1 Tax=Desulfofundulus sp. TaxID=2282750 RepID=UPI003C725787
MRILATQRLEVDVTDKDLGSALFQKVVQMLGGIDDAGLDWYTCGKDVYIGRNKEWQVASDPDIATLVDAANILLYGERLTLD